ncbi:MAG: GlsB/YeaQ/YmgE family stress response membrane protein [Planctomycetaceae bacterium]
MGILAWIVLGLLAGIVAKAVMPGPDPRGCIVTILLGIAGAFVGGFIGTLLGFGTVHDFDLRSLGIAILGAIVILWIYRVLNRR